MQRIALSRIRDWYADTFRICNMDWGNICQFGAVAFGIQFVVGVIAWVGSRFVAILGAGLLSGAISIGLSVLVTSVVSVGLTGAMLARLHGRYGEWYDFQQDASTYIQGFLAYLFTNGLLFVVPTGYVAVCWYYWQSNAMTMTETQALLLFLPGLLIALGVFFLVRPLFLFVTPLVVDKRMDFWSAIRTSADCARRDYVGLVVFSLSMLPLLFLMSLGGGGCNCCSIINIVCAPIFHLVVLQSYASYFGLEPDRMPPVSPYVPMPPSPAFGHMNPQPNPQQEVSGVSLPTTPPQPTQPPPSGFPFAPRSGTDHAIKDVDSPPPPESRS